MKKIIAGQIMMWSNLIAIVIGYQLFSLTGIQNGFVMFTMSFVGFIGSSFNLFMAITLQIKGYKEAGIVNIID